MAVCSVAWTTIPAWWWYRSWDTAWWWRCVGIGELLGLPAQSLATSVATGSCLGSWFVAFLLPGTPSTPMATTRSPCNSRLPRIMRTSVGGSCRCPCVNECFKRADIRIAGVFMSPPMTQRPCPRRRPFPRDDGLRRITCRASLLRASVSPCFVELAKCTLTTSNAASDAAPMTWQPNACAARRGCSSTRLGKILKSKQCISRASQRVEYGCA